MAQSIAVARAIFTTTFLRSEPPAPDVSRDDAALFARTVVKTCNLCTTSNIKLCKSFIVKYVLPSKHRTAALVKFVLTLCKSFASRDPGARKDALNSFDETEGLGKILNGKPQQPPEPPFRRLHILYILHDVVCHTHFHPASVGAVDNLKAVLGTVAELAACGCSGRAGRTTPAILDLLKHWKAVGILDDTQLDQIRVNVIEADKTPWDTYLAKLTAKEEKLAEEEIRQRDDEAKWIVPGRHSVPNDPTAPWHELPAANGLYLQRLHGYPLRASALPPGGFALRHGGAEADPALQKEVSNLYNDVLRCHNKYTPINEVQDVDALGNIIWKDPERPTRNYWGFTLDGIEKRKELARKFSERADGYEGFGTFVGRGDDPVERARALAAERGRGMGRARVFRGGYQGWRGRGRW